MSESRKQNNKFLKKIDPEWQGLFKVLCGKGNNLILAEEWIQTTLGCGYRELQNWTTIIRDLSHLEPTITHSSIILKPIFVMLTSDIQQNLLSVLYKHRHSINHHDLREFISLIRNYVYKDSWTEKVYERLVVGIEETDKDLECLRKRKHYFSESNKQLYQDVLNNLSKASHDTNIPWQRKNCDMSEFRDMSPEKKCLAQDCPELVGDVDFVAGEKHQVFDTNQGNPMKSSEKSEQNSTYSAVPTVDNCECIVISSDDEDTNQTHSKKRKRSLEEPCEQNSKKLKEHYSSKKRKRSLNESYEQMSKKLKEHSDGKIEDKRFCFSSDIQNELDELKDNWFQGQNTSSFKLFIDCSVDQIKDYLNYLELWDIEDDSLSTICEYFILESDSLSYDTIVNFLQYSLQSKFLDIKQAPSRTLATLINRICEAFPKQTIDILTGLTLKNEINSIQTDIICKLIKQSFNTSHHQYLLGYLVSELKPFNENLISILQALIDQKVEMNQNVTSNVMGCLSASALSLANSQKFGKFLLHFINKYGIQWHTSDLSRIQVILDRHTSFLKKTALLSFKKLLK